MPSSQNVVKGGKRKREERENGEEPVVAPVSYPLRFFFLPSFFFFLLVYLWQGQPQCGATFQEILFGFQWGICNGRLVERAKFQSVVQP